MGPQLLPSLNLPLPPLPHHVEHPSALVLALQPFLHDATKDDVVVAMHFLSAYLNTMDHLENSSCAGSKAQLGGVCERSGGDDSARSEVGKHGNADLCFANLWLGQDDKRPQIFGATFQCNTSRDSKPMRRPLGPVGIARPATSADLTLRRSPVTSCASQQSHRSRNGELTSGRSRRRLSHASAVRKDEILAVNEEREQKQRWQRLRDQHSQQVKQLQSMKQLLLQPDKDKKQKLELTNMLGPLRDFKRRAAFDIQFDKDMLERTASLQAQNRSPSASSSSSGGEAEHLSNLPQTLQFTVFPAI